MRDVGRAVIAGFAGLGIYVLTVAAIAGTGQLELVATVRDWPWWTAIGSFLGAPLLIATGMVPAYLFHALRVRAAWAYVTNTIVSAYLGSYAFVFNFSVGDGAGAIVQHIPKNGRDFSDGWVYAVPPFARMLGAAFSGLLGFRRLTLLYFWIVLLIALAIAWAWNRGFWRSVVEPALEQN